MKNSVSIFAIFALCFVIAVASGCKPAEPDLPVGHPTKISKLHSFNVKKNVDAPSGTATPTQ
jgi:hypothetical protein